MIKNERQYQTTKAQAEKFAQALRDANARSYPDPLLAQLERDALRSQLEELEAELAEYDRLRSGQVKEIVIDSFDQFPRALVQARIAAGWTQKDLAERLGLKEQQIQRYEATDYASAGLSRILEIVNALGGRVRLQMTIPTAVPSPTSLFRKLKQAGVAKELLTHRLLNPTVAAQLESSDRNVVETAVLRSASVVSRVYGWPVDDILGKNSLEISPEAAGLARFKLPVRANETQLAGYVVYARHLAALALKATPGIKPQPIATDATAFRRELLARYGELSFLTALRFAWDLGVVVLPLQDRGAFHGATWRIGGRNVVVLKQRTKSLARWLVDLIHELFHAGQEPGRPEREVIEVEATSLERLDSEEEQQAIEFSGDVVLRGRAEELAEKCVEAASGRMERLKLAVPKVAEAEGVPTDVLANYMAYRLSLQGQNWWGAATNLQPVGQNSWGIARDQILQRLCLDPLDETDRELLVQALTTQEQP
jgi:transcriptional regulator with XRE-family HTH domain